MAWTTPKTWADGDIPDAGDLNTHIKANLDALSTHAHSGAAGDGSAALAPVSTITFENQGSTPAAPGSAKVAVFSEAETMKVRAGASGAATVISLAGHVHTLQERQMTPYNSAGSSGNVSITGFEYQITTSESGNVGYNTITPNSAKSAIVCNYSVFTRDPVGNVNTATITYRVKNDGVQFDTGTFQVGSGSTTTHGWSSVLIDPTVAAHVITMTLQADKIGVRYYSPMTTAWLTELSV